MKKVKIESILANSEVRKGIEIISSIPFFVGIFTIFFFFKISSLHSVFMTENIEDVVKYSEKIFVIGKMFAKNPDKIVSFRWVLLLETILVSLILSISLYQSLLIRILPVDNKGKTKGTNLLNSFPYKQDKLQLIIGEEHKKFTLDKIARPKYLIVPEKAMFQNFLITGTIGTGKTASVMYPLTKQALFYEADNPEKKAGFLILDVKGNFYQKVLEFARQAGREDDIVIVSLKDNRYNPVHKPNMESSDLAGRCKKVISLFAKGAANKDSFWDNKAMQMMTECIRLLRITEKDIGKDEPPYISLEKIHKVVTDKDYRKNKINQLKNIKEKIKAGIDMKNEHATLFNIMQAETYFDNEFNSKAETTIETIKACVTEMTSFFVSSEKMQRAFSPKTIEECDFLGFEECINEGKIVVLALNAAEYPEVSKSIAAYMKLDFQSEIMQRTSKKGLNKDRPMFFISDEYQVFVTDNDGEFYALSRESKCCSIVASQSYTSILKALGNKESYNMLHQNLVNKIFLRTDDKETVDVAQFLTGKEDKEKFQKTISESLSNVKKDGIFGELKSERGKSGYSEGLNVSLSREDVFDTRIFTQVLKAFTAVAVTATDDGMAEPYIVHLYKYFEEPILGLEQKIKKAVPKNVLERNRLRKAFNLNELSENEINKERSNINEKDKLNFRKMFNVEEKIKEEHLSEKEKRKMKKDDPYYGNLKDFADNPPYAENEEIIIEADNDYQKDAKLKEIVDNDRQLELSIIDDQIDEYDDEY